VIKGNIGLKKKSKFTFKDLHIEEIEKKIRENIRNALSILNPFLDVFKDKMPVFLKPI
jgi:hypothetical protein